MCFNLYSAKEVRLFPDLGIYSGIFAIYLQFASKDLRTTSIIFYALCILYVLSTANVVSDLLYLIIDSDVSDNSIRKNIIYLLVMLMLLNTGSIPVQLQIDLQSILFRVAIVKNTVAGCCDFIAQCTLVCINHCTYHLFYSPKSSQDLPLLDLAG